YFLRGCITAAETQIVRDSLHAGAVCRKDGLCVRDERGELGPGIRSLRICRDRRLDYRGGSLLPRRSRLRRNLLGGENLHKRVHRYKLTRGRGDQRIAAQRGDSVCGGSRITQQSL